MDWLHSYRLLSSVIDWLQPGIDTALHRYPTYPHRTTSRIPAMHSYRNSACTVIDSLHSDRLVATNGIDWLDREKNWSAPRIDWLLRYRTVAQGEIGCTDRELVSQVSKAQHQVSNN